MINPIPRILPITSALIARGLDGASQAMKDHPQGGSGTVLAGLAMGYFGVTPEHLVAIGNAIIWLGQALGAGT